MDPKFHEVDDDDDEIIEEIRLDEDLDSDSDNIPIFINKESNFHQDDRSLFSINDDEEEEKFFSKNIDVQLSSDTIAKHFKQINPPRKNEFEKSNTEEGEDFSLSDDVILINDKKININSLKSMNEQSHKMIANETPHKSKSENYESKSEVHDLTNKSAENTSRDSLDMSHDLKSGYDQVKDKVYESLKEKPDSSEPHSYNQYDLHLNRLPHHENIKENFSFPHSFATTTSTEYKTINDEFASKYLNIDYEFYDRQKYIEKLETQVSKANEERDKLNEEILILKSKLGQVEILNEDDSIKKFHEFENKITNESSVTQALEKFREFFKTEIFDAKAKHDKNLSDIEKNAADKEKENEMKIDKLRLLLCSVKTSSREIDNLRNELEIKHEKELKELREYFENRCVDIEKQYSDEIYQVSQQNSPVHTKDNDVTTSHESKIIEIMQEHEKVVSDLKSKLKNYETGITAESRCGSKESVSSYPDYKELQKIKTEYENRLEKQVALAREDVIHEIEKNIQALLLDKSQDDSNWPSELILLREKLTATNQLEIAQLKIKHEEEMARVKSECDIQMQRKLKRHAAFDSHRDLEKIIVERDYLRDLSNSLRLTLWELAKYFNQYDTTMNEELNKTENGNDEMNVSIVSNLTKRLETFKPDISSIMHIVEDPQLLSFISKQTQCEDEDKLHPNIANCLERLKTEANNILELSEQLYKKNIHFENFDMSFQNAIAIDCEEEDGLKSDVYEKTTAISLPTLTKDLIKNEKHDTKVDVRKAIEDRDVYKSQLNNVMKESEQLKKELTEVKRQLESQSNQKEIFSEGFGIKSPLHRKRISIQELQEKAKSLLLSETNKSDQNNNKVFHQFLEDFCCKIDHFTEDERIMYEELQEELNAADKKLKANKIFIEQQTSEREQERDEYLKNVEKLQLVINEKIIDRETYETQEKEKISLLQKQIDHLTEETRNLSEQKIKNENDIKASVDKVYDLREIISDLETQIQEKSLSEKALLDKCEKLEHIIESHKLTDDHSENDLLESKEEQYVEKIQNLESQLKIIKSMDNHKVMEQMAMQFKNIESLLDRKIKHLEAFHADAVPSSVCSSPSEDVSKGIDVDLKLSLHETQFPFEGLQIIIDKIEKHSRVEDVTTKRITDLEMTINTMRKNFSELQQERDLLGDRCNEQLLKISSLQARLDEQRLQSEELNKQNTSDLAFRNHDLQNEVTSLNETLVAKDKQISNLNQLIEHSKRIIERQDQELAISSDEKSLYDKMSNEIKSKNEEIKALKGKIKSEMVNRAVIPDLMETMIEQKNEEIQDLKEKIASLSNRMGMKEDTDMVLSTISEYDEPDILRKMVESEIHGVLYEPAVVLQKAPNQLEGSANSFDNISTNRATIYSSNDSQHLSLNFLPKKLTFASSGDLSSLTNKSYDQTLRDKNDEIENLRRKLENKAEELSVLEMNLQVQSQLHTEVCNEKGILEQELENIRLNTAKLTLYDEMIQQKDIEINNLQMKINQSEFLIKQQSEELENMRTNLLTKDETINQLSNDLMIVKNKSNDNEKKIIDLQQLKVQLDSLNDVMEEKDNILKKLESDLTSYEKNEYNLYQKAEQYDKMLDVNRQLELDIEKYKHELCLKTFSLEKCKIDLMEQAEILNRKERISDDNFGYSVNDIATKLENEIIQSAELDGNIMRSLQNLNVDESMIHLEQKEREIEIELEEQKARYQMLLDEFEQERKHFNEIHMQDAALIESMNMRLKTALYNESILKKIVEPGIFDANMENIAKYASVQRTKSFDNNFFAKKVNEQARRFVSYNDVESEVVKRLGNETKLLNSDNAYERDRVMDLQKVFIQEREKFNTIISDQQNYIDQLKEKIKKLLYDNNNLEDELLQIQKIKNRFFKCKENEQRKQAGEPYNEVSKEFLERLEKINFVMDENIRENHRMNDTLKKLLLAASQRNTLNFDPNFADLEEQNNFLLSRYMRCESFRKALIFQKRFLMISLSTLTSQIPSFSGHKKKRKRFRSIVLTVIAIERFKFIAKRWSNKKMMLLPRKSQSTSNNNWVPKRKIYL